MNGIVNNEDVDYFSVQLEVGQRLAVEVEALRLGNQLFDVKSKLFDPAGRQVLTEDDTAMAKQDMETYHEILVPTVPLSRHIFKAPTRFYKTGVVFMAYLNGHQKHFTNIV